MKRSISSGGALLALALALVACSPALPPAPAHERVAPPPPTAWSSACWVELGDAEAAGWLGMNGEPDLEPWLITFSALLVRHAGGDVLVDTGMSAHFDDLVKTTKLLPRLFLHSLVDSAEHVTSLPDALGRMGEKASDIHSIVLSHVHSDHAGGILDLPAVPVLIGGGDADLARKEKDQGGFDVVKAVADSLEPRVVRISFAARPYETFERSFDVFGDGTVVLVPLPGHTPGSLGTFVNLPGLRIFHVGDAANTFEAVRKRRGKSLPLSFTDRDGAQADETLAKITQLHQLDPNLVILPAHDRRIWTGLFGGPGRCFPPGNLSREPLSHPG